MPEIYQDYDDEPEDLFWPLPGKLSSDFYALEMDGFTEDIGFYQSRLKKSGSILEMGCGTGRIAGCVANKHRFTIGIDISFSMLQRARRKNHPHTTYLCMDMTNPSFSISFDTIIIPYNTLNLLKTKERISTCLRACRTYIKPTGRLLVQLFVPTNDFIREKKKTFQFQMFDRSHRGKLIKEIIKEYHQESETILVEERYRVRPMQKGFPNEDYHSLYDIAAFSAESWLTTFKQAGFTPQNIYGDASGSPYDSAHSSILFGSFSIK